MTLATISEALDWVAQHWDGQRPAPVRLHRAHATDGALGAPAFTAAFAATLDGSLTATSDAQRTVHCGHPLSPLSARDCPECFGVGVKDVRVDRYRFPMSLALDRLSNTLRPRRQPHPFRLVLSLADHAWDWQAAARSLDMHPDLAEALFLRALRMLHGRYEEGPVRPTYRSDRSDSQRQAEAIAIAS